MTSARLRAPVYVDLVDIGEERPDWIVKIDVPQCLFYHFGAGATTTDLQRQIDEIVQKYSGDIEVAEQGIAEVLALLRKAGVRAMTGVGIE